MKGDVLQDIPMECCMPYAYLGDRASTDEGHRIACKDPVPALELELWGAGVGEAYAVAP